MVIQVLILFAAGMAAVPAGTGLAEAIAHANAGRLDEAETALRAIIAQEPRSAEAHYQLGVVLFRKGSAAESDSVLTRAAVLAPNDTRVWKALGVVRGSQAQYQAAADPLRRACELDSREPDACYFHGRNLYALNQFEPSIAALQKALAVDSRPARVYQGLAQAQEALGRSKEAEENFQAAIAANRKAPVNGKLRPDEDPRIHYAVFLFRQGRTGACLEPLESVLAEYPKSAKARLQMGRTLYQLNRPADALPHLQTAVDLDAKSAAAHLLLAKVYQQLSRNNDAARHFRAAQSLPLQ